MRRFQLLLLAIMTGLSGAAPALGQEGYRLRWEESFDGSETSGMATRSFERVEGYRNGQNLEIGLVIGLRTKEILNRPCGASLFYVVPLNSRPWTELPVQADGFFHFSDWEWQARKVVISRCEDSRNNAPIDELRSNAVFEIKDVARRYTAPGDPNPQARIREPTVVTALQVYGSVMGDNSDRIKGYRLEGFFLTASGNPTYPEVSHYRVNADRRTSLGVTRCPADALATGATFYFKETARIAVSKADTLVGVRLICRRVWVDVVDSHFGRGGEDGTHEIGLEARPVFPMRRN